MKLALIGNMNNNNFAMLRYFRALGVDANLLLMSNDGKGYSSHFRPEDDTHDIDKWKPYIYQTAIPEDIIGAFDFPISWLLAARSFARSVLKKEIVYSPPISRRKLKKQLVGYTHYIGSGILPAVFNRADINLDIFYPYAIGVEYVGESIFKANSKKFGWVGRLIFNLVSERQRKGIKNSKYVINIERSITEVVLSDMGVASLPMLLPMIFNDEEQQKKLNLREFENVVNKIQESKFSVVSHARLLWSKPLNCSDIDWLEQNKNNDRFIRAFARFAQEETHLKPVLILFEYGPDVIQTKQLITELGIADYVYWLPKSQRKNILWLISRADLGIGEFYDIPGVLWGGTALEVMACGKPVIQGFSYTADHFSEIFEIPMPPILAAQSESEIYERLQEMARQPSRRESIGRASKAWFDGHNGRGLAKRWLSLLENEVK